MKGKIKELLNAFIYSFIIVAILWILQIVEYIFNTNFYTLGIYPRHINGLLGIFFSPFIHANFQHLIANSLPFLVLSTLLFFFYKKKSVVIFILLWLTAGIFTWIIGRSSWHIGMSSVIYAMAAFLIFAGFFSKKLLLIVLSIVVMFMYSGLLWGIFPNQSHISWEGHLSGAIAGILWAYIFRRTLSK